MFDKHGQRDKAKIYLYQNLEEHFVELISIRSESYSMKSLFECPACGQFYEEIRIIQMCNATNEVIENLQEENSHIMSNNNGDVCLIPAV